MIAVDKKFGKITASGDKASVDDAVLILQFATDSSLLNEEQRALADVNGDGVADVNDAILILRYIAGLEDKLTD